MELHLLFADHATGCYFTSAISHGLENADETDYLFSSIIIA